ncbi:2-hydroxyacid dehydrogenase [Marinilabilia sp.]|jgi:D-lactate dehydrogenase
MKIAFFNTKSYDREYFERFNNESEIELTFFDGTLNCETTELTKDFEGVCVFVNDQLHADVIEKLAEHNNKIIALRCAGFNNVDLEAAEKHNIKVVRVPAYSPSAVAEHALALILTLNRKTHKAYNRVRESNFSLERLTGFNLNGKTVGVIGTGKIGIEFARIMQGLGCKVIAQDPYPNQELIDRGVEYMDTEELLPKSDIISLHCPLTPESKHLINKETIKQMKRGAMLINTSRGALINTKDAIKGLKKGRIGYLGIDVYEQEEDLFFKDLSENIVQDEDIMRLMSFPNVLITSHQAFFTREALEQIASTTIQNILDFKHDKELKNQVLPQP